MSGLILRIKTWWQVADRTQKLIAICGGGFLIVLLIGTFVFASRPKMALVFSNLDPEDTGTVALEIENMGIPVDYDSSGNVKVPSDKVPQVKASLAMKGKLPKGGSHAGADFTKVSPFADPHILAEQLKTITAGELVQSIEFFDGVDSANVQITPGVDSPFEADKKPAQANVTVSEKAGSLVSTEEARAMANLVASAVPGLDKSKVTIFSRTGRALWDGQDMASSSAVANNKLDLEKLEARKRRDELQDALNRMLGPGNAIAMVDLNLDVNEHTSDTRNVDPSKSPVETATSLETMTLGGGAAGAGLAAGLQGNLPGAAPATGGGGGGTAPGSYTVDRKTPRYGEHITEEHTKFAGGDLTRMAITVLVNQTDKIKVDPTNQKDPVVQLANGYLGPRGVSDAANFKASVVTYPFDTTQADAAKKAEATSASSGRMQQILSILPIAALLIVAVLVMKSIGKLANRPLTMLASAGGPALTMSSHGGGGGSQMFANAFPQPQKSLEAANRFVLPEIVKQKALEAGISEEQLKAAIEEAGDAGISVDDIPSIKSKINVPLEQIKKMANERPEAVAMLIKSWLIEEGIRR